MPTTEKHRNSSNRKFMNRANIVFSLVFCIATGTYAGTPGEKPLMGFTSEGIGKEQALERQFDSSLKRDDLRVWMKRLSAHPHNLGYAYDKQNADFKSHVLTS